MNKTIDMKEEGFNTSEEFKQWLKEMLHDQKISEMCITFTKTDGTERTLRCTLREDLIPTDKAPKGTGSTVTETTQRVFDLDIGEWRSFRWENVKQVNFQII